jgi:hypothetical protein
MTANQTLCPVSEIAGETHYYKPGTGHVVPWDVMGDPRYEAQVCPDCAQHSIKPEKETK